jgi:membrane fusion protein, copper/silver efflux system
MKKQFLGFVLGVVVLPLGTAIAQDHSGHNMDKADHKMDMNHEESAGIRYDVSADFQKQMNAVYQASLELNKAFVADDAAAVKEKAGTMIHRVSEVDMSLLKGEAHMAWMKNMKAISDGLDKITVTSELDAQRKAYASVSENLYHAVKSFGVGETVYYQYCPMEKSSWLSDSEEVNNPYFGSKMLKCGSTKETID